MANIGIGTDKKGKCMMSFDLNDGTPGNLGGPPPTLKLHIERPNKWLHLTAFGVGLLAFLVGFGVCYLWLVR